MLEGIPQSCTMFYRHCYLLLFLFDLRSLEFCLICRLGYCLTRWAKNQSQTNKKKTEKTKKNSIPVIFDWFTGNFMCVSIQSSPPLSLLVSPEKCQPANRNDKQHANLCDLPIYAASKLTHTIIYICRDLYIVCVYFSHPYTSSI